MGNKLGNMGGIVALLFDGATCQFSELPKPDDRESMKQVYSYIDTRIRKKSSYSFILFSNNINKSIKGLHKWNPLSIFAKYKRK